MRDDLTEDQQRELGEFVLAQIANQERRRQELDAWVKERIAAGLAEKDDDEKGRQDGNSN